MVRSPVSFPAFLALMLTVSTQAGAVRIFGHLLVTLNPPEAVTRMIVNGPLSSLCRSPSELGNVS